MFYKENKKFLTKEELDIVSNVVLGNNFPWFYEPIATTDKFQLFCHTLIKRYDVNKEEPVQNSEIFPFFNNILLRFCNKNKIKINKITRAVINLTSHHNEYKTADPHVDHNFKHKAFMIYLNDTQGDTIIYDKKFNNKDDEVIKLENIKKPLKILKSIKPEIGKAICWDGEYYHAATYPKSGNRRVVLVITFF